MFIPTERTFFSDYLSFSLRALELLFPVEGATVATSSAPEPGRLDDSFFLQARYLSVEPRTLGLKSRAVEHGTTIERVLLALTLVFRGKVAG